MHRIALFRRPAAPLAGLLLAGLVLGACDSETPPEPLKSEPAATAPVPAGSQGLAELDAILDDGDALSRSGRLASLLPTLSVDIADEVRDAVILDSETAVAEFALVGTWWGRHDGPAAYRWARAVSQDFRIGVMMAVLRSWAEHDPTAAAVEVQALSGSEQWACQAALIRGWFVSGKPGLLDYIQDLGEGSYRQLSLSVYSEALYTYQGSEAVIAWADGLKGTDDRFHYEAERQAVYVLAGFDRPAAIAWAERRGTDALHRLVASRWAGEDGAAAIEWASQIEDARVRRISLRMAYRHWLLGDRLEAVEWARTLDADQPGDLVEAAGAIAMSISWVEPLKALRWIDHMENPDERERARITVLRRWRKRDETAARAWLDESDYSLDMKRRILTDSLDNIQPAPANATNAVGAVDAANVADPANAENP
jgi:hypothetical protein